MLKRSDEMESLMRRLGMDLSEQHAAGEVKSSGDSSLTYPGAWAQNVIVYNLKIIVASVFVDAVI